jgi:hypothetical protein
LSAAAAGFAVSDIAPGAGVDMAALSASLALSEVAASFFAHAPTEKRVATASEERVRTWVERDVVSMVGCVSSVE